MTVAREHRAVVRLNYDPPVNFCRPSVDVLFSSVASAYGPRALGVVLTGMGQDGLRGSDHIRTLGGRIFAQDQHSSVVWGMPGYVARANLAHEILPLGGVAQALQRAVAANRRTGSAPEGRRASALERSNG
jgi:two-component system chemotaxis response regulator CheB